MVPDIEAGERDRALSVSDNQKYRIYLVSLTYWDILRRSNSTVASSDNY